ncbi:MAG: cation:proton antiporter [candidate division WOR-3 bacterium]
MGLIILILVVISVFFYFLKIPLFLSYIITGFLVSHFINFQESAIDFINYSAISILLFFIGFEFSFNKIHKYITYSLLNNFIALKIFVIFGITFAYFLSKDLNSSIIFSLVIYPSSSIIVIKILQITNRLANIETPIIIIGLIFEDIFIAIFLGILKGSYFSMINVLLVILAIFINFKFKKIISKIVSFITNLNREMFLIILFSSIFLANSILNSPIGAFILGILISDTSESFFEKEISIIRDIIFILFFFFFGYSLKNIISLIDVKHILIAILVFIISILLKSLYFIQLKSIKLILRSTLVLIPRGEFSIFALYMIQNEEIKIIAGIFITLSIISSLLIFCIKG